MRSAHRVPVRITLLLAGVVAAGVLPAVSASAVDPPPVVTYESAAAGDPLDRLFANDPTGTGVPVPLSPTVHVSSYDVSEDGNTLVAAVSTRDFSSAGMDTSWGVVLVSRASGTTHLIGTNFDSPVAISADGRYAYWMSDGWWIRSVDGAIGARMPTPQFVTLGSAQVFALAVSPDGTMGAVLARTSTQREIRAFDLTSPNYGGVGFQQTWALSSPPYPVSWTFTWLDNTHLMYGVGTSTALAGTVVHDMSSPTDSPLGAVYDVSHLGSTWYMWKDAAGVTTMGSTTDTAVAPVDWAAKVDGSTTYAYDITATTPPAIDTADNRTSGYLVFAFTKSAVFYGQRAVYASRVEYNIEYAPVDYAYWNCRGTLQYSIDRAVTWRPLRTTSCATLAPWPGGYLYHSNGYTQVLTRNTWFRWSYPGDALTMPATSATRVVTVTPTITVKIARSGSSRKVYGAATRIGGTAYLQKWSPTKRVWVRVATTRLTSRGAYSFGYRVLARGSYRVWVLKDYYWNAAIKRFTI